MGEQEQKEYFISPSVKEIDTERIPIYDFETSISSHCEWHFFKDPQGVVSNAIYYNVFSPSTDTYKGQIAIDLIQNPPVNISAVTFWMLRPADTFDDAEIIEAYNALTQYFVGITCDNNPYASLGLDTGCELLLHYDKDNDGLINLDALNQAYADYEDGVITNEEWDFVSDAYINGGINAVCPGCYTPPPKKIVTFTSVPTDAEVKVD